MATVIKIKTSNLDKAPVDGLGDSVLATGELAYSYYTGAQNNNGDRIYIGTGTETNGLSADYAVIGGKYFTDMLDHVHGTLTASSGIIVDSNKKIDELRIDNVQIGVYDTNTISIDQTSDANGDLKLIPGGTGDVVITATNIELNGALAQVGDQTITGNLLITGTGKGDLHVDGESTLASAIVEDLTDNRIVLAGSGGAIEDDGNLTFDGTTFQINSTAKFTVDVTSGNTKAYGTFEVDGESTLASAIIEDLTNNRVMIVGAGGAVEDDANLTFDGTSLNIGTGNFTVAQATGNTYILGTLEVDGALNLDSTQDTTASPAMHLEGRINTKSINVRDLTASRVTFAGADGLLTDDADFTWHATNDKLDITGSAEIDNITFDGNTISTTTGALTIAPNASDEVIINTTSAIRVPVGNSTQRPTAATGQIRYNTTTSQYEGYSSGAWQGLGGVIDVDQNTYIIAQPTSNLSVPSSQSADTLYFVTGGTLMAQIDTANGLTIDNGTVGQASVNINSATISTSSGDLYLDPGNTGSGSPTGAVVIYGDLQVQGTTTTVNSTTVQIDDPVFTLGDAAQSTDDNKDRGIEFHYHDGTNHKTGFFGFDDSTGRFKVVSDAVNTSEVFSGSVTGVEFGNGLLDSLTISAGNFTANSVPYFDTNGDMQYLDDDGTSPYGTDGQILQMNSSGVPFFGHIDCGTY